MTTIAWIICFIWLILIPIISFVLFHSLENILVVALSSAQLIFCVIIFLILRRKLSDLDVVATFALIITISGVWEIIIPTSLILYDNFTKVPSKVEKEVSTLNKADIDERIKKHYEHIDFENKLINDKINWILGIQSIILAAYGLILKDGKGTENVLKKKEDILKIIAFAGIFINLFIAKGIVAGYLSINRTLLSWQNLGASAYPQPIEGHGYGFIPSIGVIIIFLVVWNILVKMIKNIDKSDESPSPTLQPPPPILLI